MTIANIALENGLSREKQQDIIGNSTNDNANIKRTDIENKNTFIF